PERGHLPRQEESVIALSLVAWHQQDPVSRGADVSAAVARQDGAGADDVEAGEPGPHGEAVALRDNLAMEHLHDRRAAGAGPDEELVVSVEIGHQRRFDQTDGDRAKPE